MVRCLFVPFMRSLLLAVVSLSLVLASAIPAHMQDNYTVAIVVVDDFTGVDLSALDPAQFDEADTCAVSLEGQAAYAVRGASEDPISVSHGDLVYAELEEMLDEAGVGGFISLVEVDIQGVTTDVVADRISSAIDTHSADFYVINMSFAIIPCEYIQAFADYGSQMLDARDAKDLNRYRSLFQRAVVFYDNTVFPAMSQRAQETEDLDPLQTLFAELGAGVIPIASAGNFGLDFPFWPGAWGQVVSVSGSEGEGFYSSSVWDKKKDTPLLIAEDDQPGKEKRVSNYGEVMMPGEYNSEFGIVSGTSFAAPRLSFVVALYVSEVGNAYCRTASGAPALAYGDWDNLTLEMAVQQSCADMEPYLP